MTEDTDEFEVPRRPRRECPCCREPVSSTSRAISITVTLVMIAGLLTIAAAIAVIACAASGA